LPFGQTTALAAPAGGERETIGAGLEILGQVPANFTTLLALRDSNALAVPDLSHDAEVSSTLPMIGAQAAADAGISLPAGPAGRPSQGLVARMQTVVQPLVRNISALGDRLRAIFKSIFAILQRPRPVSDGVGASAAWGQLDTDEVGLAALPATMQDGLMELWDLALQNHSEDWPPISEPSRDSLTSAGVRQSRVLIPALMAIGLNGVRSVSVSLPRSLCARGKPWSEPRDLACLNVHR
jgi:hypothetical protein